MSGPEDQLRAARVLLRLGNVCRLKAFGSLCDFKVHLIALVQGLVPVADDLLEVDEHIFARFALNESEALGPIEPLYCSRFH
jgi:hypothetical protein